ncbi:hypothetical protein ACN429_19740 [Pseudomonas oryzihabitans]|uniref:hypothetical protein n=1 Tax=Pseudomonas oryzihabitans TaxID=47885 RepID=UPI00363F794B
MTAVIFDAFGTLAQITEKTHPYRAILKEGVRQGRQRNTDDRYKLLAENHNLNDVAEVLNIQLSASQLIDIEQKNLYRAAQYPRVRRRYRSCQYSSERRYQGWRLLEPFRAVW